MCPINVGYDCYGQEFEDEKEGLGNRTIKVSMV